MLEVILAVTLIVAVPVEAFLLLLLAVKLFRLGSGEKNDTGKDLAAAGEIVYQLVGFCVFGWWWLLVS